jgi:2-polyprenyl-3-methyl-5-hydroxy-6-metoxy-1,4-benzoquinol methylase
MTELPEYRQRIYERYASCFQDTSMAFDLASADRWGRAYDSYLKGWLPEQKDAAILEVACGGGRLLHFFKKRGYTNLIGVDISPEQIQLAKQVTENVVETDVLEFLETTEEKYDLIVGLDFIEHFHKNEALRLLEASFEALKPNGRLILQTPNAESPWVGNIFYGDFTHEICFTPKGLQHVLNLCGFHKFQVRETGPAVHGFASVVRYIFWQMIRLGLKLWNLIETGNCEDNVFTRTFLISAHKK